MAFHNCNSFRYITNLMYINAVSLLFNAKVGGVEKETKHRCFSWLDIVRFKIPSVVIFYH